MGPKEREHVRELVELIISEAKSRHKFTGLDKEGIYCLDKIEGYAHEIQTLLRRIEP